MSIIEAILLGLLQGITEFLPISSTGHLLLADSLFNLDSSFEFDVLLNIGTIVALVIFYRATILQLIKESLKDLRVLARFIVATIPAVLIGFTASEFIENSLRSPWVVVVMLVVIGVVMVIATHKKTGDTISRLSLPNALKIGVAQSVALIPGTSRSGMTILAGQHVGLSAVEAAKFSFMLAIPTITGATLKVALSSDGRSFFSQNLDLIIWGNIASFLAGILAVRFLISVLSKNGLKYFGWYRIVLGVVLAVLLFAKIV